MSEARIAHSCTDISDGLQAACRNILAGTTLGIELDESKIPVHPTLIELAKKLELTPLQLSMAGGDWQFLYCIPKNQLHSLQLLEEKGDTALTVVGEVTHANGVWAKIEHDSFTNPLEGKSYFEFLSEPQDLFE